MLLTWHAGKLRVGVLRSTTSEEVPQTGFESPRPLWVAVVHGWGRSEEFPGPGDWCCSLANVSKKANDFTMCRFRERYWITAWLFCWNLCIGTCTIVLSSHLNRLIMVSGYCVQMKSSSSHDLQFGNVLCRKVGDAEGKLRKSRTCMGQWGNFYSMDVSKITSTN
jgi:hypothetical protein